MTDKLAEAIAYYQNVPHGANSQLPTLLDAAVAYHALPVVDLIEELKDEINNSIAIDFLDARQACHALLKYLCEKYPDGLRWAK